MHLTQTGIVAALLLIATHCSWASSPSSSDDESWYPRTIEGENGAAVIHAPQIDAWQDFETITAWAAFEVTGAANDVSYYGSLKFNAQTDTDIAAREVLLHEVEILELSIDGLTEESDEYLVIRDGFIAITRKVPLDLVLAYLPNSVPLTSTEGLNTEPPTIFVSDSPAILLFVDGEPRFLPIEDTDLQFVLNTTWDLLRDGEDGPLFLCHENAWLTAKSLNDEWKWAKKLPRDFGKIPDVPNWAGVRDCLPDKLRKLDKPDAPEPTVFHSSEAAELLLTDGTPYWVAIGDSGLTYADNTEQELFRVEDDNFILLSGRWFRSTALEGPWTLATELPEAFQDIPPEDSDNPH